MIAESASEVWDVDYSTQLQWSRDQLIAESPEVDRKRSEEIAASMEPRSCDRGKRARFAECRFSKYVLQWSRDHVIAESRDRHVGRDHLIGASMEPRSCDRGKATLGSSLQSNTLLQWSRDHVIAERIMPQVNHSEESLAPRPP